MSKEIKKISTEIEYSTAVNRLKEIFYASAGTSEDREAILLSEAIVQYEDENCMALIEH